MEMESRSHSNHQIFLICPDYETLEILKKNVTIFDALSGFCRIIVLGRRGRFGLRRNKLLNFVLNTPFLIYLLLSTIFRRSVFFHFKALDRLPWLILFKLAPNRTYCFESSPIGMSELEAKVTWLNGNRSVAHKFVGKRVTWRTSRAVSKKSESFENLDPSHGFPVWRRYLEKIKEREEDKSLCKSRVRPFCLFILSSMDHAPCLADPDGFYERFVSTLDIINNIDKQIIVKVKVHPATLSNFKNKIFEHIDLLKSQGHSVQLINGHPQIESVGARFCVANVFSTTFYYAKLNGVPTIEYTDYSSDVLSVTKGGSMRPDLVDFFVQNNEKLFAEIVNRLVKTSPKGAEAVSVSHEKRISGFINEVLGYNTR